MYVCPVVAISGGGVVATSVVAKPLSKSLEVAIKKRVQDSPSNCRYNVNHDECSTEVL